MTWANPEFMFLLILIPFIVGVQYYYHRKKRLGALIYSDTYDLGNLPGNWKAKAVWASYSSQVLALVFVILSLARPQVLNETVERKTEGIDIVICLDLSSSMLAEDLRPNRFIAAKNLTTEFINNRRHDRIGLVIFRKHSFTILPPTSDYQLLLNRLHSLEMEITEDGTAIGMGIATSVNRLRNSQATSRVIIMLTDGENNAGEIDPLTAADLAAANGIRVYTIGVSTEGTAPYPIDDPVFGRRYFPIKVDIDEPMLTQIAEKTGGKYFRARDTQSLSNIYREIDQLETSEVDEIIYLDERDLYPLYLLIGVLLLILGVISDRFLFRSTLV